MFHRPFPRCVKQPLSERQFRTLYFDPGGNPFHFEELVLAGRVNGWLVSKDKTPRETGHSPGAPENEQGFEQDRRELRKLIDRFPREPGSNDDGGYYRNVGRLIIRPLMNPHSSGDKGR
jgi:hypothetical protein